MTRARIVKREPEDLAHVELAEDSIHIHDEHGKEVVMWIQDEWIDDPSVVLSIANAICIFYEKGPDAIKELIGRIEPVGTS
jgi:hypothetical protein